MKKGYKFIFILGLILILLSGCNNNDSEINKQPQNPNNTDITTEQPDNSDVDNSNQNNNEDDSSTTEPDTDNNTDTTFKQAFPQLAMENPASYLEELVPGFRIGLTKEEAESLLGKPYSIQNTVYEWEEREESTYNDFNNYQFVVSFNNTGHLANFKLIKELNGNGIIPIVKNKVVPADGEILNYAELGFEGVNLGFSIDEALESYGEPIQSYLSYDSMYGYTIALVYKGVTLNALLGDSSHIQFIESNHFGTVETYRGIKVGDTVDEVLQKYGEPPYDWREAGDLIYATEDYWFGIKFHIENDKVKYINIYEAS